MARVLIVDDDADGMEPVGNYLTRIGHTVDCVPNGKEALMAVIARPPDVIILDILMPEMDGAQFLQIIRSYLRLQSLPVVVLTGAPDSPTAERARHLSVNQVLVKSQATLPQIAEAIRTEQLGAPATANQD